MQKPTEEHLHLALQVVTIFEEEKGIKKKKDKVIDLAYKTITEYVIFNLMDNHESFTEEDAIFEISKLIGQSIIDGLINEGLVEEDIGDDGECFIKLTNFGKKLTEELNKEYKNGTGS